MKQIISSNFRLGILGGGQLGKMLIHAANNWDIRTWILDPYVDCPCADISNRFVLGDITDAEIVYDFGDRVDLITIEIEHVNTEAMIKLQEEGKTIHPNPHKLEIIKDKGLQKQFLIEHQIHTEEFWLFDGRDSIKKALQEGQITMPFVQKQREEGYDGRGVKVIDSDEALKDLLKGPSLVERKTNIDKELSVIVARNENGEVAAYPPVEMDFHPEANLVEYIISPARIPDEVVRKAEALAIKTVQAFELCGLLAVEMFLNKDGELLVNEVAPRPHNSGHHTIESCVTSQYEQHIRAICNFPLGSTRQIKPAVMVNILGEPGHNGPVSYEKLHECLKLEGVHIHIYGKRQTRPFRKMGHVTVVDDSVEKALEKAKFVKENLKAKVTA